MALAAIPNKDSLLVELLLGLQNVLTWFVARSTAAACKQAKTAWQIAQASENSACTEQEQQLLLDQAIDTMAGAVYRAKVAFLAVQKAAVLWQAAGHIPQLQTAGHAAASTGDTLVGADKEDEVTSCFRAAETIPPSNQETC